MGKGKTGIIIDINITITIIIARRRLAWGRNVFRKTQKAPIKASRSANDPKEGSSFFFSNIIISSVPWVPSVSFSLTSLSLLFLVCLFFLFLCVFPPLSSSLLASEGVDDSCPGRGWLITHELKSKGKRCWEQVLKFDKILHFLCSFTLFCVSSRSRYEFNVQPCAVAMLVESMYMYFPSHVLLLCFHASPASSSSSTCLVWVFPYPLRVC